MVGVVGVVGVVGAPVHRYTGRVHRYTGTQVHSR